MSTALSRQIDLDQQAAADLFFCLNFAVDRSNHPLSNGQAQAVTTRGTLAVAAEKWFENIVQLAFRPPRTVVTNADLEAAGEKRRALRTTYSMARCSSSGLTLISSISPGGTAMPYLLCRPFKTGVFDDAPLGAGRTRHIATFGRGDFFGGLAFLDGRPHDNDAIAATETEFLILSLEQFNKLAEEHKKLAFTLLTAISRSLALRLRHADTEIAILPEY